MPDPTPEQIAAVNSYWAAQPSPRAPELTNAEFAQAVKTATQLKYGGHASAAEASGFWREFQALNANLAAQKKQPLSPQDITHAVKQLAPVSFTYHGRPPTMQEIAHLHDQPPQKAREYFANLPDRHYPDVTAGQMVASLVASRPHANEHIQRDPTKNELRYLIHSQEKPAEYYKRLGAPEQQAVENGQFAHFPQQQPQPQNETQVGHGVQAEDG